MKYGIKDACDFTIINKSTGEETKFNAVSRFDFDYKPSKKDDNWSFGKGIEGTISLTEDAATKIEDIVDAAKVEITYEVTIENKKSKVRIGNIPLKYMKYTDDTLVVTDIVNEYCENIVRTLYNQGNRFDTDEVYNFEDFLVGEIQCW